MTAAASPGSAATVLVVDDTPANLEVLVSALSHAQFGVLVATNGSEALERARREEVDLILLDVMMPGIDGFETCARLKRDPGTRDIPVIFMTALTDTADKVKGFAAGAVDYVTKPIRHEEVLARVETHLALRRLQRELEEGNRRLSAEVEERRKAQAALGELNESLERRVAERTAELEAALAEVERLRSRLEVENQYLQEEIGLAHDFQGIISSSESFRGVLSEVEQVADTGATVLILGETGTGKELLARAVHDISRRRERPLVKVNCAALAENLIESELFGHEKGAFTGAAARRTGRFELADGGTLFLDEVGELPHDLQAKMLRVLQEGEFERLGGTETLRVDVRVIAATNRDLERDVEEGRFRRDLFYRLNVFPIRSLPLRERREDIPLLVRHFVGKFSGETGRQVDSVPTDVMERLISYDWPGNVRELENVVERAVIVSRGGPLRLGEWFARSKAAPVPGAESPAAPGGSAFPAKGEAATLEENERRHILEVLELTGWRIRGAGGAAERLAVKPTTLESRMKRLNIERRAAPPTE